jgi:transposase
MTAMSQDVIITEEMISRQPAEAQVIIRLLLAKIAELESRLNKTPRNSSLPPSSVHPHAKPAPPRSASGKKPGGQPGHEKHERALIPTEDCTQVIPLKPRACRKCGKSLRGNDSAPLRHQVWELPEIKPLITEYQQHRLVCECCGVSTRASLPDGVPQGQTGERLAAVVGLLMAGCRQSKRKAAWLCEELFRVPCSPGLIVKLQKMITAALRPTYEELCAALPDQAVLNIDESPTKQKREKAWLWSFVARQFTVFAQRTSREATVPEELLGPDFTGVIGCDRAKMYYRFGRLQWCWAHLRRDFQALVDSNHRGARRVGAGLLKQSQRLFRQWWRFREGKITRAGLKQTLSKVRSEVESLLYRGFRSRHTKTAGLCTELLHHRDWLWTFLECEGVEPTNNASERALRPGVIWRKLSFGTQSAAGSRFVETLLTVIETCRQQSRRLLPVLTTAMQCFFHRRSPTGLLFDTT